MNSFFSTLKQMGIEQYGISIQFDGDKVSVSVLPKSSAKDKALQSLKPLNLRGNVQEVDEQFFQILQKPLERTKALFRNTAAFERSLKETEQKTQRAKKKKEYDYRIVYTFLSHLHETEAIISLSNTESKYRRLNL